MKRPTYFRLTHTPIESTQPYTTRIIAVHAPDYTVVQAVRYALGSLLGAIISTVDPDVVRALLDDLWVEDNSSGDYRYITTPSLAEVLAA